MCLNGELRSIFSASHGISENGQAMAFGEGRGGAGRYLQGAQARCPSLRPFPTSDPGRSSHNSLQGAVRLAF